MGLSPTSIAMAAPAVRPQFERGTGDAMRLALPPLPGSAQGTQTPAAAVPGQLATNPTAPAGARVAAPTDRPLTLSIPPLPGSARAMAAEYRAPVVATIGAPAAEAPPVPAERLPVIPAQATAGGQAPAAPDAAGGLSLPPLPGSARAMATAAVAAEPATAAGVPLPPSRSAAVSGGQATQAHGAAAAGLPQMALSLPPLDGLTPSGATASGTTDTVRQYADAEAAKRDPGLTTGDVIDMVNPLQHLPIVSIAYREMTGDEIRPHARIIGGGLYGGFGGLASSFANVAVEGETGKDIGEHIWDGIFGDGDAAPGDSRTRDVMVASRQVDMTGYGSPQLAFATVPGMAPTDAGPGRQFAGLPATASMAGPPAASVSAEAPIAISGGLDAALNRLAGGSPPVAAPQEAATGAAPAVAPPAGMAADGDGAAQPAVGPGLVQTGRSETASAGIPPTNLLTRPAPPAAPEPTQTMAADPGPDARWFDMPAQSGPPRDLTDMPRVTVSRGTPTEAPTPAPAAADPTAAVAPTDPAATAAPSAPAPASAPSAPPPGPVRAAGNPDVVVPFAPPPLIGTPEGAPADFIAPPNPNDAQDIGSGLDAALMRLAGGDPAPRPAAATAAPGPSAALTANAPRPTPAATAPAGAPTAPNAAPNAAPSGLVATSVGDVPSAMMDALAQYQAMQGAARPAPRGATVDNRG